MSSTDKIRCLMLIAMLAFAKQSCAQSWMTGFSYRKKITIQKSKVSPVMVTENGKPVAKDLSDFQVLIEVQDADLVHVPGSCMNKVTDISGRDISFAVFSSPALPLNFQLESYEPTSGKLTCWVKLALLSANGTATPPTELYLYYGGTTLSDPNGSLSAGTWTSDFIRVWHMSGISSGKVPDALGVAERGLMTGGTAGAVRTGSGKIGPGAGFSGSNGFLRSPEAVTSALTISVWLNTESTGSEQVIFANDSINGNFRNGCVVKLTADGKPVLEMYRSMSVSTITGNTPLKTNKWHYLVVTVSPTVANIRLDDKVIGSKSPNVLGTGGSVWIGSSKQGGVPFSGMLDELRIQNTSRPAEWYSTQRINQDDPTAFVVISEEEYDPSQYAVFTGTSGSSWELPANWKNSVMPSTSGNAVIGPGKSVVISSDAVTLGKLTLKNEAHLISSAEITVGCGLSLDSGTTMQLTGGAILNCLGSVVNHGSLTAGTISISGKGLRQELSGQGHANTEKLEINKAGATDTVVLKTPVDVAGWVELKAGLLDAGGFLTLDDAPDKGAARILPVLNTAAAGVTGNVNVQQWLPGSYPPPGSARSWRLLSSPVIHDNTAGQAVYTLAAYQQAMFITGPGGAVRGFDPSPLNNSTVYTHDATKTGSLTQKYVPIADMAESIPLGKGIFAFSRGARQAINAYATQIQGPVFSNPDGYYVRHTGKILTGQLDVDLSSTSQDDPGHGFNLIGNPYPAPVLWGALEKTNLGPYVWMYDPMNKDYKVSDAPDTEIPAGTGFFVKLIPGKYSGNVRFHEQAKKPAAVTASRLSPGHLAALASNDAILHPATPAQVSAQLVFGRYADSYQISFSEDGNHNIDEFDAPKISEGIVSISVARNDTLLAIEKKGSLVLPAKLKLRTVLPGEGSCRLSLQFNGALLQKADVLLTDLYTKDLIRINKSSFDYLFSHTEASERVAGKERFVLELIDKSGTTAPGVQKDISRRQVRLYPNPASGDFFIETPGVKQGTMVDIEIADVSRQTVAVYRELAVSDGKIAVRGQQLGPGIYLLKARLQGIRPVVLKLVKL